jgi:DNA repair protein RadD
VHGTLDAMTRAERLEDFKLGELRALTSMDVLTTGYDEPAIDAIAMLRPTKSAGLYVQMVGRGFRLHPSKVNTLVLDFAGNVERFGPVDTITVKEKTSRATGRRRRRSARCARDPLRRRPDLPACQFEFPEPEKPPLIPEASTRPILSTEPEPIDELEVDDVVLHAREAEQDAVAARRLRARGYRVVASEWICFEHTGFARTKAEQWWALRSTEPPPATVARGDAPRRRSPRADVDQTQRDGKFTRVVSA